MPCSNELPRPRLRLLPLATLLALAAALGALPRSPLTLRPVICRSEVARLKLTRPAPQMTICGEDDLRLQLRALLLLQRRRLRRYLSATEFVASLPVLGLDSHPLPLRRGRVLVWIARRFRAFRLQRVCRVHRVHLTPASVEVRDPLTQIDCYKGCMETQVQERTIISNLEMRRLPRNTIRVS